LKIFSDKKMIQLNHINFFFCKKSLLFLLVFFSFSFLRAQVSPFRSAVNPPGAVTTSFLATDIELQTSDIVSNVLRIVNRSKEVVRFTIDIASPDKWKLLGKSDKVYALSSFDSVFIPVRLIPSLIKGSTHYIINAFLVSEDNSQLGNAHFFAHTKKVVKWDVAVGPREKIYFLNNEKSTAFSLSVFNEGNEQQDILLTMNETGKNMVVSDTNNKIIDKKYHNLNLKPQRDTTLNFRISYFEGLRNQKRIDADNFTIRSLDDERKYTLYIQTQESRQASKNIFKKNKKLEFIRLGNRKKVNPYGSSVFPLVAEANIYNVLSGQPIMNLLLRGSTILPNKANLVYFTQTSYNSYFLSKGVFFSNVFYVGYFHPTRGSVQVGNVGGSNVVYGVTTGGKGINASFNPDKHHTLGAFLTGDQNTFSFQKRLSMGISHRVILNNKISINSQIGRSLNKQANTEIDFWSIRTTIPLFKNHHIGATVTGTTTNYADTLKRRGRGYNLNYSGDFLKGKLHNNINVRSISKYLGAAINSRLLITSSIIYDLNKKWNIILQDNYNRVGVTYFKNSLPVQGFNSILSNQLLFARKGTAGKIMPGIFYSKMNISGIRSNAKGAGVDYNLFETVSNLRFSTSLRGYYYQFEDFNNLPQYFTFQFSSLVQYKTVSANVRYMYGPTGADTNIFSGGLSYPQNVFLSVQHQYQFSNQRFLLQTNANYSYYNRFYTHSFGIYPELYYTTLSGWRFRLSLGYNINSNNYLKATNFTNPNANPTGENDLAPKVNKSYNISIGIRKEFGIPIPKFLSKKRFTDIEFIAFLDVNGNRKMDRDEVPLENIVIKLGENDILSDDKGRAFLQNIEAGTYRFTTFSLVELGGWFSIISDSLVVNKQKIQYIPFVRGVKIYGNVILDREKYAKEMETNIELSRIRITATDSLGNTLNTLTWKGGEFQLYVPYGKYVLTMDEVVLNGRFALAQNNIKITLKEGMESLYTSFYIIERRRKISTKKFDSKGQEIKEK